MIQVLIFLFALLLSIIGFYFIKKAKNFSTFMNKGDLEDNIQFFQRFGVYYLILAVVGVVVGLFDLTLFSLFYLFSLLIISAVFSIMFAKKIR